MRGGVRRLTLIDGDILGAGNLCRHSLLLTDVGEKKAEKLAEAKRNDKAKAKEKTKEKAKLNGNADGKHLNGQGRSDPVAKTTSDVKRRTSASATLNA